MSKKDEIKYLLERYISQEITGAEYQRLFKLLQEGKGTVEWTKAISEMLEQQAADPHYESSRWEPVITKILQSNWRANGLSRARKRLFTLKRIAAAAAVILLTGIGIWFSLQNGPEKQEAPLATLNNAKNDIHPGDNKAVLRLANGQLIVLDSIHNGTIAMQGKTQIVKANNGQLIYRWQDASNENNSGQAPIVQYNTISTPIGGQYQLILPDGSKVWLNAGSSIKFPTAFTGKNREVQITGEAYFDVAKDETKPFIVSVNNMHVKVLGTQFNIMAYDNEPTIKTTLLKGAVEVTEGNGKARLKPGQQAVLTERNIILTKNVDADEVVAWKNGLFQFLDDGIAQVMRQIARWYNVEIVYENEIPEAHITGKMPRNTNLTDVLKVMQLSGIHFKIEGRKVIVLTAK